MNKQVAFKYVVVGGGIAGGRAADGIRALDKEGSILIVTQEGHFPYQRPPLSKGYLLGTEDREHVLLRPESHYQEQGIVVMTGVKAVSLDTGAHSLALSNGNYVKYDKLLLATGGFAWKLPIQGSDLPEVFTLRTIDDSDHIREAVGPGKSAVVIGGSFIGSEVSASLAQMGVSVTMVFLESRLLERVVSPQVSHHLHRSYEQHGVRIIPSTRPEQILGTEQVEAVRLEGGETLNADLVVMGVGIKIDTELAREADLTLTERGAVQVDRFLRSSDPDIYAAGDIAAWPDPTFRKVLRVEHWDVARRQGTQAGRNMAGEGKAYTALPYFYSDLFDLSFEAWGDLSSVDQTLLRGEIARGSFALFYFQEDMMTGVLAVGRPDEERKPLQALVKARAAYSELAYELADERVSLNSLAERVA